MVNFVKPLPESGNFLPPGAAKIPKAAEIGDFSAP
tara:strand:- start:240 stop:344 length:105 start_codon:yes stop_codon:yes gene_type:complete